MLLQIGNVTLTCISFWESLKPKKVTCFFVPSTEPSSYTWPTVPYHCSDGKCTSLKEWDKNGFQFWEMNQNRLRKSRILLRCVLGCKKCPVYVNILWTTSHKCPRLFRIALVFVYLALWLFWKTDATFSTNQIQDLLPLKEFPGV